MNTQQKQLNVGLLLSRKTPVNIQRKKYMFYLLTKYYLTGGVTECFNTWS